MERLGWRAFEEWVREYFGNELGIELRETGLQVGPNREHKFDLVSPDGRIVIECKSYTWTDGQNFPQAKISTANEALLFLSRVHAEHKLLVMQDDLNQSGESLVKTYVDRYGGLMDDTEVWRYLPRSEEDDKVERVRDAAPLLHVEESGELDAKPDESAEEQSFSGKYEPLYQELADATADTVKFSFDEINSALDDQLPDSAYKYRTWWNPNSHSHAERWESLGWTVSSLDLSEEVVEFEKK